ncbi:hypothetical protein LTR62_008526 [Meristemomyces frigidus]|uniref:Uncharacterized protein n=1 Tax=Meristemomyces frigidus TaxID=1508187 RepID=A0AAN7TMX9_9PEZI|nr:hypothetical protein LTR62_008526 [Meristemomyces frigidus]
MADDNPTISYEDLASIEDDFEEVDTEIMRKQYEISQPAYEKRAQAVAKIPTFWPLVFEQAPPEIDQYIQPADSQIINEHLESIEVNRIELDEDSSSGNPRSIRITFDFKPNEYFSDKSLSKTFWYRRAADGWTGLVSEPVKVHWKKGKDTTEGLNDGAHALFAARKKVGDMAGKGLPEYTALAKKLEHWNGSNTSFFTWFGFVSGRRYVSAEESKQATEHYQRKKSARKDDEQIAETDAKDDDDNDDDDDDDDAEDQDDQVVEVHEAGEDLAVGIAEDIWPNAIKYFTQAQEMGDMSDPEFEEDDEDDEEEGDDEPIDIRRLVQDTGNGRSRASDGPPAKRVKR